MSTPEIERARRLARETGQAHIVLENGAVYPDTPASRECDMGSAIVYIARPNGIDWKRPI